MGEIIPFSVRIILCPVLKIHFELLGSYGEYFVKAVFLSEAWKWEK